MVDKISNVESITKNLLKDNPEFTTFEAYSLAIQIQRNEIIQNAFVVPNDSNSKPSALEMIAMVLNEINKQGILIEKK